MELFFDLDGTLTDPGEGITRCIAYALEGMGHPAPSLESLRRWIGPPLWESFPVLLQTEDPIEVRRAVDLYRERFTTEGMFENRIYPGIPAGLAARRAEGHRLRVVTVKPHLYARKILEHFGLASLFEQVYGSELSGENSDKAELIRLALTENGIAAREAWMIGDRRHDIEGARANGVGAIGVLWGYGSAAELRDAGADALIGTIDELGDLLRPPRSPAPPTPVSGGDATPPAGAAE